LLLRREPRLLASAREAEVAQPHTRRGGDDAGGVLARHRTRPRGPQLHGAGDRGVHARVLQTPRLEAEGAVLAAAGDSHGPHGGAVAVRDDGAVREGSLPAADPRRGGAAALASVDLGCRGRGWQIAEQASLRAGLAWSRSWAR